MSEGKHTQGPLRLWNTFDAHDPERDRLMAVNAELLDALKRLLERYADLANSGDCGNWNCEEEPQVIAARAAIAKAEGGAA